MTCKRFISVCWVTALLVSAGCSSLYYGTMEKFGVAKRDLLVDRITAARNENQRTKEQFRSALDQYRAIVAVRGGTLDEKYYELNASLQRCEHRAQKLEERIRSVEEVSDALFNEWASELKQYKNVTLRQESEKKMYDTKKRYLDLIRQMKLANSKIEPVLEVMRDQVLFLKHNLNAQAISSLQDDLKKVESEVSILTKEIEKAITDADAFIQALPAS